MIYEQAIPVGDDIATGDLVDVVFAAVRGEGSCDAVEACDRFRRPIRDQGLLALVQGVDRFVIEVA